MNSKRTCSPPRSLEAGHFRRLYTANADPWNYVGSAYEKAKRDATIEALRGRRFRSGLEVGCSIGLLTQQLASCCDMLLAVDFVAEALDLAQQRCAGLPVAFANVSVPTEWPVGRFDLIVLSEMLYFLSDADSAAVAHACRNSLDRNGEILLVNWLGASPDDCCTGEAAAARFIADTRSWLQVEAQRRWPGFRLDSLRAR